MMNFSSVDWGGALSHFGEVDTAPSMHCYDSMQYKMMGMNPDRAVASGLVPPPDYIKIDVDGIEHEIFRGMRDTLLSVKAVLVEVDVAEIGQREACGTLLSSAGLKLALKNRIILMGSKNRSRKIRYGQDIDAVVLLISKTFDYKRIVHAEPVKNPEKYPVSTGILLLTMLSMQIVSTL